MEGVNCELVLYAQERWRVNQSLLLHCHIASELWSFVLCLFGAEWEGVLDMLACRKR